VQEYQRELGNNIPAAAAIFHHKEEGSDQPARFIPETLGEIDYGMALSEGKNYSLHGP
jgi:hypothetical protein